MLHADMQTVSVVDLGLWHDLQLGLVNQDLYRGSPAYMSPEVFVNKGRREPPTMPYDAVPADVWSLGVCLFVMLMGFYPLDEHPTISGYQHLQEQHTLGLGTLEATCGPVSIQVFPLRRMYGPMRRHQLLSSAPEAADLLDGMLEAEPAERLSLQQILTSEFVHDSEALTESEVYAAAAEAERAAAVSAAATAATAAIAAASDGAEAEADATADATADASGLPLPLPPPPPPPVQGIEERPSRRQRAVLRSVSQPEGEPMEADGAEGAGVGGASLSRLGSALAACVLEEVPSMEWRSLSSGPPLFHGQPSGGYASMATGSWNDVDEDESVEQPSYRSMEAAGPPEVPPPLKRQLAVAVA